MPRIILAIPSAIKKAVSKIVSERIPATGKKISKIPKIEYKNPVNNEPINPEACWPSLKVR